MIVCSTCGAENDATVTYCANCGAANAISRSSKPDALGITVGIVVGFLLPFGYVFIQMFIVGLGSNMACPNAYVSLAVTLVFVLALIAGLIDAVRHPRPDGQFMVALTITALAILALPVVACSAGEINSIVTSACVHPGGQPATMRP